MSACVRVCRSCAWRWVRDIGLEGDAPVSCPAGHWADAGRLTEEERRKRAAERSRRYAGNKKASGFAAKSDALPLKVLQEWEASDREGLPDAVRQSEAIWEQDPGSIFHETLEPFAMAVPELRAFALEPYDPCDRDDDMRLPPMLGKWFGMDMVQISHAGAEAYTGRSKASLLREAAIRRWLINADRREAAA